MEDVAAADRVPGDHGDHRLGGAPDLDLQVEHVEAAHAALVAVTVVAPDPLVAAGAERFRPGAGQDDHADLGVVPGHVEGLAQLEECFRTEGVADLGTVDRDLGDPVMVSYQMSS